MHVLKWNFGDGCTILEIGLGLKCVQLYKLVKLINVNCISEAVVKCGGLRK